MAPKKSSSSLGGGASIAKSVGRGAKSGSFGNPLAGKKAVAASSPKPQETIIKPTTYSKEQLEDAQGRQELDPNNSSYNALWEDVKKKMGMPKNAPSE
jgi:hypothetical protein